MSATKLTRFATYTFPLMLSNATPMGSPPTAMFVITVSVAPEITLMLAVTWFAT
jgi:hypothetical protein